MASSEICTLSTTVYFLPLNFEVYGGMNTSEYRAVQYSTVQRKQRREAGCPLYALLDVLHAVVSVSFRLLVGRRFVLCVYLCPADVTFSSLFRSSRSFAAHANRWKSIRDAILWLIDVKALVPGISK